MLKNILEEIHMENNQKSLIQISHLTSRLIAIDQDLKNKSSMLSSSSIVFSSKFFVWIDSTIEWTLNQYEKRFEMMSSFTQSIERIAGNSSKDLSQTYTFIAGKFCFSIVCSCCLNEFIRLWSRKILFWTNVAKMTDENWIEWKKRRSTTNSKN